MPALPNLDSSSEQRQRLKRFLKISLGLHLGIGALTLVGNFLFPGTPEVFLPSVQIDMVALPDLVKAQNQPYLDKTLPVKDAPPPPPKSAEKEPEPKKEEPKDDRMSIEREKQAALDAKKALERLRNQVKKNQQQEAEKKAQEIRDQKQADMKRFMESYRNALKGNQVNEGSSATGINENLKNAYLGSVQEKIRANWGLPAWLQNRGLKAQALVQIGSNGSVVGFQLLRSSGNETFDEYVKQAVQHSNPFPPPPEEMGRTVRSGIGVNFPL